MTKPGPTSASHAVASAHTLVVKMGSSLLVDAAANSFRDVWFKTLVSDLVELRQQGKRVIVVSSGAIALGCLSTGRSRASQTLAQNQASAAVGQIRLAREFEQALAEQGIMAAQVLLTLDDTEQRTRYLNARKALEAILDMHALPFINENDTVATSEIRFGDNDRLAARVAQMMSADCLLLLSDVAGLYEQDPRRDPNAALLERVDAITPEIQAMAGSPGSAMGSGGMATKIDAAAIAVGSGCDMVLASGLSEHPVRAVTGSGLCTHFVASGSPVTQRKQWIAGSLQLCGEVWVDQGAVTALNAGSSLLPVGVTKIVGAFERGDAVSIVNANGHEMYRGLCAYGADDARRIMGLHSQDIVEELGFYRARRADTSGRSCGSFLSALNQVHLPNTVTPMEAGKLEHAMHALGRNGRSAARALAQTSTAVKNRALALAADNIRHSAGSLLEANAKDLGAARDRGLAEAMLDRLALDRDRIDSMAAGLVAVAELDDPVGSIIAQWQRPNGLDIARRRVPLGVIGIIYESRPNVTVDAAALCIKSGNAAILRGGSESFYSSQALYQVLSSAFDEAGLPTGSVQMVPTRDRAAVGLLLGGLAGAVDLLVPRGGRGLIERVQADARVPVLGHLEGICHVFVDGSAKIATAVDIVINSKMRRTGICGAAETLLLDASLSQADQTKIVAALLQSGCEVRGDERVARLDSRVVPADAGDWGHEFLAPVMAARCVEGVEGAIEHIGQYGSGHTESIVGENASAVERFLNEVDSAIVLHNASTQFADGSEFGMGAEIGISTGKLHARGPVGVEQLTSFKYVVRGTGQTRP